MKLVNKLLYSGGFRHRIKIRHISLLLFRVRQVTEICQKPIYHVIDSKYYYHLLPYHLADLTKFPADVIDQFANGGFVMAHAGNIWSRIGSDETHE